jgi:predicted amidophosphoribosyltransferase
VTRSERRRGGSQIRGGAEGLSQFALREAARAAGSGKLSDALRWLESAPPQSAERKQIEAETRYRLAGSLIGEGRYKEAESHLSKAGQLGVFPPHLVGERLRLVRGHAVALRDLKALRSRWGDACENCKANDLYRLATCEHRAQPMPPAVRLAPNRFAPTIRGVYAASAYRSGWDVRKADPMSTLIRMEKRKMTPEVMRLLGALLADYVAFHTPLLDVVDAVVPVPTSRERELARGGGLPHHLGITVRDRLCLPLQEAIVQTGQHLDHTQAGGEFRKKGLRDVWRVRLEKWIVGRSILLIDDILTTGTTITTAAELLLQSGAGAVYAAVLSHTERSG